MKRALTWFAGLAGIAALGRVLARRATHAPAEQAPQTVPDPAEELRRRLAAQRGPEQTEAGAPAAQADATIEERRAEVHARAQEAIEAMREQGL